MKLSRRRKLLSGWLLLGSIVLIAISGTLFVTGGAALAGNGPVGHWPLDRASGSTAYDDSGNGINGTCYGGPIWRAGNGYNATCLDFDGVNDQVYLATSSALNFSGEITLAVWIRPDTVSNYSGGQPRNCIAVERSTKSNYLRLFNGQYQIGSWVSGQGSAIAQAPIPPSDLYQWIHLVGTYGADGYWRLYRNGVQVAAVQHARGAVNVDNNWRISRGGSSNRYFDGQIRDVRIYNRGLSAAEVKSLYTGIAGRWEMEDATNPLIAPDTSPLANTASLTGGPTYDTQECHPSLVFDGVDDVAAIGNPDNLHVAGQFSLSTWVQLASEGRERYFIYHHNGVDEGVLFLTYYGTYQVWVIRSSGSVHVSVPIPAEDVGNGDWVHLMATHDGRALRLYRNGVEIGQAADTVGAPHHSADWYLGGSPDITRQTDGKMRDVRIYHRGLTAKQVVMVYGTLAHWKLEELSGRVAYDSGPGGNLAPFLRSPTLGEGGAPYFDAQNYAIDLDGTSQMLINNPLASTLNGLEELTLMAWVQSDVAGEDRGLFTGVKSVDTADNYLGLRYATTGQISGASNVVVASLRTTEGVVHVESTAQNHTTGWQHITLSWESGQPLKLYLNGKLNNLSHSDGPLGGAVSDVQWLGWGRGVLGTYWDGRLDDVRIYSRVLCAEEIAEIGTPKGIRIIRWQETR